MLCRYICVVRIKTKSINKNMPCVMLSYNVNFAKTLVSFCVIFVIGYALVAYKRFTKQLLSQLKLLDHLPLTCIFYFIWRMFMRFVRAGMTVLLSPAAGLWFSKFSIPSPGHILIYGPPVSSRPHFLVPFGIPRNLI